MEKLKQNADPKGKIKWVKAAVLRISTTDSVKKCNADLEWTMKLFEVRLIVNSLGIY